MDGTQITVTLPDALLRAARDVAFAREITVQEVMRQMLQEGIARHHRQARSPVRADERGGIGSDARMIDMCRARFAEDFAYAADWMDLLRRLRDKGVHLREAGGGLALYGAHGAARLCKASDIGYSLNRLVRRFRAPFPGEKLANWALFAASTTSDEVRVLDPVPHRPGEWPEFPPRD